MTDFEVVFLLLCAMALAAPLGRKLRQRYGLREPDAIDEPRRPATARYRSLADAMADRRGDNLLLLRLLAASLVIYAHSYAISGIPGATDLVTRSGIGIYAGSIAVYVFFIVSGFLVTGSWLRRQHLGAFLASRALRILPAYAVCLAGSALVLGACVTTLDGDAYFAHADTWRYITHNLVFPIDMQWTLPGVFETHDRKAVNGSLWTLPAEVRVYTWLALFAALGLLVRVPRTLLALLLLALLAHGTPSAVPLLGHEAYLPMAACFALGALAWLLRRVLPLNVWTLLGLLAVALLLRGSDYYLHAFLVALAYGALWFAYVPKQLLWFNRFGDYSYGLYLWGYPMQQLAMHLFGAPTPTQISLFAWPAALLLAMASWHLVERPMLRFRRRPLPAHAAAATPDTPAAPVATG